MVSLLIYSSLYIKSAPAFVALTIDYTSTLYSMLGPTVVLVSLAGSRTARNMVWLVRLLLCFAYLTTG